MDVDLDLRASAGNEAKLTVVETLAPIGQPLAALRLHLESTVYTFVGQNLATRREHLIQVTDEAGRSLPFAHRKDEVVIQLAQPAPAEKPFKLKFEIDGDFLIRPGGDSYWQLGSRPWFLSLRSPVSSTPSTRSFKRQEAVRPVRSRQDAAPRRRRGRERLETRIDKPIQFAVILAGKYEVEEETGTASRSAWPPTR